MKAEYGAELGVFVCSIMSLFKSEVLLTGTSTWRFLADKAVGVGALWIVVSGSARAVIRGRVLDNANGRPGTIVMAPMQ